MKAEKNSKRLKFPADWIAAKARGRKISLLTCYDAVTAALLSQTSVDAFLIGDSLGMVVQGRDSTLGVRLRDIIYHSRMVRRGAPESFLIADMPFGSFQAGVNEGIRNGLRLMKKARVDAVKLEGAHKRTLKIIRGLVQSGVPVMGHIGLTPQSFMNTSGFRVQGKTDADRKRILSEAHALEEAGCFAIVLELMKSDLSSVVTEELSIPTVGIGAGSATDAQVLVLQDLLGMFPDFRPRHVRTYANLSEIICQAAESYHEDILAGRFPGPENSF